MYNVLQFTNSAAAFKELRRLWSLGIPAVLTTGPAVCTITWE